MQVKEIEDLMEKLGFKPSDFTIKIGNLNPPTRGENPLMKFYTPYNDSKSPYKPDLVVDFKSPVSPGTSITNNSTGVKEANGKLSYELDWMFIDAMARRMSKNKRKYGPYNWQKPMDVEQLKQAMFRHVISVMNGDYEDEGVANDHLVAIALNAMFINYQLKNK